MISRFISDFWDKNALPSLMDFIRIPAKSTAFDPDWEEHGLLRQTCEHVSNWIQKTFPMPNVKSCKKKGKRRVYS